ncbi:MAG: MBOAT family protein [Planctomycetes bacterium]|nr:MBOAT family protein [Planctomycetota bacterium]
MQFNSAVFFLFLACVYTLYWLGKRPYQNALLLVASYVFYGWWDWRFLGLILFTSGIDYATGLLIESSARPVWRRVWLAVSLVSNFGILLTFKYLDFFLDSASRLAGLFGWEAHLPTLRLILPVGVSFYTFQSISYTIDVFRRDLVPTRDPIAFLAYVAFFPQLVAGPIERATHLLPQFGQDRRFDRALAADGCRQMLYGLFLKVVVADNLAPHVDMIYDAPGTPLGWDCLLATYFFALQIYGDFAGYSHIAIGCARLFGFRLTRNFAYPYFSQSLGEFWHRWHVSLSTWFRDYVYIPLGGSRGSEPRRRLNLLLTFVSSGLWHGAALTYPVWGLVHGLALAARPGRAAPDPQTPGGERLIPDLRTLARMFITFHLVCCAWIVFRAHSLTHAGALLRSIGASLSGERAGWEFLPAILRTGNVRYLLLLVAGVLAIEWIARRRDHPLQVAHAPLPVRWTVYYACVFVIATCGALRTVPFIYFQF